MILSFVGRRSCQLSGKDLPSAFWGHFVKYPLRLVTPKISKLNFLNVGKLGIAQRYIYRVMFFRRSALRVKWKVARVLEL